VVKERNVSGFRFNDLGIAETGRRKKNGKKTKRIP
jgi:hypothetical protein